MACGFVSLQFPPCDVPPSLSRGCGGVPAGHPLPEDRSAADSLDAPKARRQQRGRCRHLNCISWRSCRRRCASMFFISAPHDTSFASTASLVLLRGLFWYYSRCCGCCPPFCCCLALGADGALTFEVTDTITKVTLEASRSRTIVCMAAPRPAISLHESERERARLSA